MQKNERIANAVPATLYSKVKLIVNIVVLNCNQCLQCQVSGHKIFRKSENISKNLSSKLSSKIVEVVEVVKVVKVKK